MVTKNNPLKDSRHLEKYFPYVDFIRRPTSTDIRHPKTGRIYSKPYFWRVKLHPNGAAPDTGNEGELWYLEDITANVADWKLLMFTTGGTQIITISGDSGGAVPGDGVGDMDLLGNVVTNATNSKPVFFLGTPGSFKQDLQVQVSTAVTGAPGDKNDTGLSSYNDTQFTVDTDGYVELVGASDVPPFLFKWNEVTGTSDTFEAQNGYITNNAGLVTLTLPSTCAVGDYFRVAGLGAGGWAVAQNASQTIHFGNMDTTTGVGGSLASTNRYDCLEFLCVATNNEFLVLSSVGNITVT